MTAPTPDQPPSGEPDSARSGADVAEAIEVAEGGSAVEELHTDAEGTKSGEAPVERAAGDPDMTQGQVVYGPDDAGGDDPEGDDTDGDRPETTGSGAAQSVRGARASDLRSAGRQP